MAGKTVELAVRDLGAAAPPASQSGGALVPMKRFYLGLAGAAATALLLGSVTLGREPLWNDELETLDIVSSPLGEFVENIPNRQNGLLYDLALWPIVHLGGDSSIWLRLPALLAVVGAVILCGFVGMRLSGRVAGLLAAFLLALHPFSVYFAQEGRPYGFVLFFSLLAVLALLRALERPTLGRWLAYAMSVVALTYSHDFAVLSVLAHPALVWSDPNKVVRRHFLTVLGGAALVVAPIVVVVSPDWASSALGWVVTPAVKDSIVLVGGGLREMFASAVIVAMSLAWVAAARNASLRSFVTPKALFLGLWLTAPFAVLLLMSFHEPVLVSRYILVSVPAFCLICALSLAALPRRLTLVGAVLLSTIFLAGAVQQNVRLSKTDWPAAAADLAAGVAPGEPIGTLGDGSIRVGLRYYQPSTQSPGSRATLGERRQAFADIDPLRTVGELSDFAERAPTVWLVEGGFVSPSEQPRLARFLEGCQILEAREFRGGQISRLTNCAGDAQ